MDKCEFSRLRVILMDNYSFSFCGIYTTFTVKKKKNTAVSMQIIFSWRICLTFSTIFICRI